jgi:hypothetical protein
MPKYQVTISFEMDEDFMSFVPQHRQIIDHLINTNVIDYYSVSMESMRSWMIINAQSKKGIQKILVESPLHKYWQIEIDELFVFDSASYRLPEVVLN